MAEKSAEEKDEGALKALEELYEGHSERARAFRYGLLAFDAVAIVFVVVSSFFPPNPAVTALNLLFGAVILVDLGARVIVARHSPRRLLHPTMFVDLVVAVSFLAPIATGEGLGFLRVLRTLRLLHTYQMLHRLRADFPFFRRHEDVLLALVNLVVFLTITTGLVYETQHRVNEQIGNYADALYFTVTALTTTGFGDITLEGTGGRLISVAIMIVGVTLFLRLAQILFQPEKVRHECPTCGLIRHDNDAIHCKHCGTTLHIETEGAT